MRKKKDKLTNQNARVKKTKNIKEDREILFIKQEIKNFLKKLDNGQILSKNYIKTLQINYINYVIKKFFFYFLTRKKIRQICLSFFFSINIECCD